MSLRGLRTRVSKNRHRGTTVPSDGHLSVTQSAISNWSLSTQVLTREQETGIFLTVWAFSEEWGNDTRETVKFGLGWQQSSSSSPVTVLSAVNAEAPFSVGEGSRSHTEPETTSLLYVGYWRNPVPFESQEVTHSQLSVRSPLRVKNTSSFLKRPTGR